MRDPVADYDAAFYAAQREGSRRAAALVVPQVLAWTRARSVVDVGCGTGAWVEVALAHGVVARLGIDGAHVPGPCRVLPPTAFLEAVLARPLRLDVRFDVAFSLEVAEHLPPARTDGFVADLCALAPVVVFSAAVPGQGGDGHVHEPGPFTRDEPRRALNDAHRPVGADGCDPGAARRRPCRPVRGADEGPSWRRA